VEEHFYLFWPLLIWSLPLQGLRNLTCGILLVEPLGRFFSLKFFGLSLYFFTFGRLDSLAYGALLAILLAGNQYRQDLLTPLFRTLLILLSLVLPAFFWAVSGYGIAWVQAVKLSLIPAFYFSLMGFCLVDPKSYLLTRLLSVAWLRRLGVISYGIYVYHSACFDVIIKYSHPSTFWLKAVSSVGLTLIVSELSFRFFESPILKLKRHFQYETCSSG
jgi:peptidoglycan/LPS O-acetylase OafA/YrhL